MKASPDGATIVDLPALRQALATLEAHEPLILASLADEYKNSVGIVGASAIRDYLARVSAKASHDAFISALDHIVTDEFRGGI